MRDYSLDRWQSERKQSAHFSWKDFKTPLPARGPLYYKSNNKNLPECLCQAYDGGLTQASLHCFINDFSHCPPLPGDDGEPAPPRRQQWPAEDASAFGPGYYFKKTWLGLIAVKWLFRQVWLRCPGASIFSKLSRWRWQWWWTLPSQLNPLWKPGHWV